MNSNATTHRNSVAAAAALALTLALAAPAAATTPGGQRPGHAAAGTLVRMSGTSITVTAAEGAANAIALWRTGDAVHVRDTADRVVATGGCVRIAADEAMCPGAGRLTELVVEAGDEADEVTSYLTTTGVTLKGGLGDDNLYGGGANDTLEGGEGADFLSGGAGNDLLIGSSGRDRILGGAGDDRIEGRNGSDVIDAGAGDDVVDGGDGNDQLIAGPGNDFVDGGTGRDTIDTVDGVAGNDYARGGPQTDTCRADRADHVTECP
ncbi:calcium-binding protein [Streptomyces manipurensis]|uniref:calcium-binding protein n=1 Tax=Streptomyces manipurensis TaxID=1077945 RepID=UPI003C6EB4FD